MACSVLLLSCNKKEESNGTEKEKIEAEAASDAAVNECYQFSKNNDTITLSVTRNGNVATGRLAYNFFEKDDSKGDFAGTFKGDTLVADFTFESEGTTSIREVVFLKSNDSYLPGYGDMEEHNNKQIVKNRKVLKFDDVAVLSKIKCK